MFELACADEGAAEGDQGFGEVAVVVSPDGEAFELVESGEGLLDDIVQLAQPWTSLVGWEEMIGTMRRRASARRHRSLW